MRQVLLGLVIGVIVALFVMDASPAHASTGFAQRYARDYNAWAAKTKQSDRISYMRCTPKKGIEYCIVDDHFVTNGDDRDNDTCGELAISPNYILTEPGKSILGAVQGSCTAITELTA